MAKQEIKGRAKLRAALDDLAADMIEGADEGAAETAELVADEWRRDVPVETGEVLRSIGHDDRGAFATSDDATFAEFGTSTQPAQPAGTMAAQAGKTRMPKVVGDAIKRRLP